jgi:predicted NACHT family NTPase
VKPTEKAGQCTAGLKGLVLDEDGELLAHERGWIWAFYYTQGKQRTHTVLVHADGTPVAASVARDVIEADRTVRGTLHKLTCLNPEPIIAPDAEQQATAALAKYYDYLAAECGYILLDGLPADAEVGSQRLRLENLFVPLHLVVTERDNSPLTTEPSAEAEGLSVSERRPVGEVLAEHSCLAILASPGGGKSTLLKRLAVAYAHPERRRVADDHLPDRPWLPLFFRCRELRDKARAPFADLVDALAGRAHMGELTDVFRGCIEGALRSGEVLLLVEGLDEISDTGARAAFVRNLRTFLAVYPSVSLVVTSREAGFRQVAGLLAAVCRHTRLADFDADDIRRLSVAWHREVVGDRPDVIADAEHLASTVADNDRISRLTVNPLLLTTLLLVKRWVGQLPTRRSVLYGKAVEVLLMTWNVEGHDPIEQEEALPQLCYVAYAMMQSGVQKVSRPDLTRLLRDARGQLSAELAFARSGVAEFIERIEHRSSLLMMTGHDVVDGTLTEFYEFRHLTLQEYLTAKAIVEGWYPHRQDNDTLVALLEPHFEEEKWREVIKHWFFMASL